MEAEESTQSNSRKLVAYFVLAFVLSWAVGVPLALANQGVIDPILPDWTHYLYGYGPMLAAVIVAAATEGRDGLARLWSRVARWRIGAPWWVVAISPLLVGLVVIAVMGLFMDNPVRLSDLGEVNFLPSLGLGALLLWIVTFGFGEEIGWRGYALPKLQHGRSALAGSLILAVFWALWHLPAFFYLYDQSIVVGWLFGMFSGAIVFTWLYNSTGGSVLATAIWHGCLNFITGSAAGEGTVAAVVSTLVIVWAVVVIWLFKPQSLSRRPKVVD